MSAAGTSVDTGTVLADRWVLTRRIGAGASSHVYAAREPRLDRWVAVKVLHASLAADPSFLSQFRNEANAVSALDADHVVRFIDAGTHEVHGLEVPYIVTALMAGGSLRAMFDAGRRLGVAQAVDVGRQAAEGLAAAHDARIVHRDVKPANLLFDADGRLALSDFGISRAIAAATSTEPMDSASGTTRYASPEQMQGRALDGRSDVYSLALVLMESVTGVVPMLADTIAGTASLRSSGSIDVSVDFGALRDPLLSATEADPERRSTASEFLAALGAAAGSVGPPARLDLVRVEGLDEQTSEFPVGRDAAGVVVLGPLIDLTDEDDPDAETDGGTADPGADTPIGTADPGGDAPIGTADPGADTPIGTADPGGDAPIGTADPAVEEERVAWGADSIATADEHARLAESVPSKLGPVEPLEASAAPGAVSAEVGEEPPRGPRLRGSHEGRRGRRRLLAVLVVLLVAGAAFAGWWFLVRVPSHEVPDLVGGDLAAAEAAAEDYSWTVEVAERTRVDGTSADEVLEQSPPSGTELAEGEVLVLTVSDGPTLTALPAVSGLPESEAVAALEAAGLPLGARTTEFNEDTAPGIVLLFAPAGGVQPDGEGRVPKGTAVDIVVSDGPAPRVVPGGLVGASRTEATAALEAVQLVAAVSSDYSDTVPEGEVIEVGIAAGTEVPRDSEVPIVVSAGPRPIVVPDVRGQSGSSAAAVLEQAGFEVSGIEGSPSGTVLATDPVAGESRQPGSSVRIFTRQ